MSLRCPHLGPRARRAAGRAVQAAAAMATVVVVRAVAGVWATAALVAVAAVAGLIAGWAAIEARAFAGHRPSPPVAVRAPSTAADHVAFARALTEVASAYLAACERQEQQR